MPGSEYLDISIRVSMVIVPVGVYFLILGLLNTRRHPQLLSGRQDFALLVVTLSPLFILPVSGYFGFSLISIGASILTLTGGIMLLAPCGSCWVIYNTHPDTARNAVTHALNSLGVTFQETNGGFDLPEEECFIKISNFPFLRNVSVRLHGGDRTLIRRFQAALGAYLDGIRAETTSAAVTMLLIATAMLVAPLAMVARRGGEIVRLITDLLY